MQKKDWKELISRGFGTFIGFAFAIAFYFLLLRFSSLRDGIDKIIRILTPFVYGGALAYLLKTPCNYFERLFEKYFPEKLKKKKDGLAVLTVLALAFIAIYTLLRIILPQVVDSIVSLTRAIPRMTQNFFDWLELYLKEEGVVQSYVRPLVEELTNQFVAWANGDMLPQLQGILGNVTNVFSSIVQVAGNCLIGFIVCVYALCARKTFARQGKAVIYSVFKSETADKILNEIIFIDQTFDGFISGKVLDSAIVGLICYAFCVIMALTRGFSNGILISLIVGVTNIIPYFGPFIGAIPSVLLIAMSDPVNAAIFLVFIVILQQFDGNVLGPRLLAGSVGLSGFWVLFSITLFSGIFGFVGVLIGVPVFAVIYDLLRRLIVIGLKKNGRTDLLEKKEQAEEQNVKGKERK